MNGVRAPLSPPSEPVALATRRSLARVRATEARAKLLEVAKLLDDGRHCTGHQNALAAVVAADDVIDAVAAHAAADQMFSAAMARPS